MNAKYGSMQASQALRTGANGHHGRKKSIHHSSREQGPKAKVCHDLIFRLPAREEYATKELPPRPLASSPLIFAKMT